MNDREFEAIALTSDPCSVIAQIASTIARTNDPLDACELLEALFDQWAGDGRFWDDDL